MSATTYPRPRRRQSFACLLIALLLVGAALAAGARRLNLPYPALLALAGAALALVPGTPTIMLDPELALALFVAPVLLAAAFDASPRDLRENWRPVASLALLAVGLTVAAVALVARWIVPDLPWAAAIALGAIVAPPDAAAATAVLRQLLSRRPSAQAHPRPVRPGARGHLPGHGGGGHRGGDPGSGGLGHGGRGGHLVGAPAEAELRRALRIAPRGGGRRLVRHAWHVTLAAALALPDGSGPGAFPYRDLILFTAFCVVVGTLVLQGLTLRPLMRALHLEHDDAVDREVRVGLLLLQTYQARLVRADTETSAAPGDLIREAVAAERRRLLALRAEGVIGDDAFHRVEEELDWAELNAETTLRRD